MADQPAIGFVERARRGLAYRRMKARERASRTTRRATSRWRLRPNFLILGAQKAGTTSLHSYLSEHPAVLSASMKEVQYFNKLYDRGESWYRAQFPLVTNARTIRRRLDVTPAVGEATAAYLFHPRVPERVHAFDPRMNLVAVIRDPVDRAYSHFQMELRWGRESCSLEDALAREELEIPSELERIRNDPEYVSPNGLARTYVARGRYAEQLELWLQFFPRTQLLVLTSEELLADPAQVMSRIASFLGIPEWRAETYPLRGARPYPPISTEARERLARTFEPHNRALEALLGRELGWTRPAAGAAPLDEGGRVDAR
jgi:hypothetical protein